MFTCAVVQMWQSEHNLLESFSSIMWVSETKHKMSGLVASSHTH